MPLPVIRAALAAIAPALAKRGLDQWVKLKEFELDHQEQLLEYRKAMDALYWNWKNCGWRTLI